jgi:hypothetical protein
MTTVILILLALFIAAGGFALTLGPVRRQRRELELDRERWEQRRADVLEERRERRRKMGLPELDDDQERKT